METDKHTDLTYLKQLSNGSNEFIVEMIEAFFEQIPKEIDNLEQYLHAKNWSGIRAVAHKIKPSIAFMGIKELESVVKLIEEYAGNESNLELLPEMIAQVKKICTSSMQELELEKELSS